MKKYFDKQYFISLAIMSVITFCACEFWQIIVQGDSIWFSIIYTAIMAPLGAFMVRVTSE
jgi:hypothetical protein